MVAKLETRPKTPDVDADPLSDIEGDRRSDEMKLLNATVGDGAAELTGAKCDDCISAGANPFLHEQTLFSNGGEELDQALAELSGQNDSFSPDLTDKDSLSVSDTSPKSERQLGTVIYTGPKVHAKSDKPEIDGATTVNTVDETSDADGDTVSDEDMPPYGVPGEPLEPTPITPDDDDDDGEDDAGTIPPPPPTTPPIIPPVLPPTGDGGGLPGGPGAGGTPPGATPPATPPGGGTPGGPGEPGDMPPPVPEVPLPAENEDNYTPALDYNAEGWRRHTWLWGAAGAFEGIGSGMRDTLGSKEKAKEAAVVAGIGAAATAFAGGLGTAGAMLGAGIYGAVRGYQEIGKAGKWTSDIDKKLTPAQDELQSIISSIDTLTPGSSEYIAAHRRQAELDAEVKDLKRERRRGRARMAGHIATRSLMLAGAAGLGSFAMANPGTTANFIGGAVEKVGAATSALISHVGPPLGHIASTLSGEVVVPTLAGVHTAGASWFEALFG